MGRAAAETADVLIVTSDNPRTEDPRTIIEDIRTGIPTASCLVETETNRRTAIARALERARPGDVVLIAGKGHETEQTIGTQRHPFDDREVAREALGGRRKVPAPHAYRTPTSIHT
jgi:UDP-N-acetylmuramoyl-L-alanyl-D-glutamate--2,6-diaminopimelate ligase